MAVGALFLDDRSVSADCRRRLRFLETTLMNPHVGKYGLDSREIFLEEYPI
jgi:hypothetical protein